MVGLCPRRASRCCWTKARPGIRKLLNIGWHLRIAGRPGRFAAFKRVLELLDSYGDRIWVARRIDIATSLAGAVSAAADSSACGLRLRLLEGGGRACKTALKDQGTARTLDVEDLTVRYGQALAVDGVTLAIEPGEVVALLGPSGCGKTTLLRVIAGFVRQAAGRVRVDGAPIDHLPANQRNIGIVFQNYALFPHMTVAENVAYGLRARGVRGPEIEATRLALPRHRPARRLPRAPAAPALGRPAAEGGARPRARRRALDPAARRAVRRARPQPPARHADRGQAPAAPARPHHHPGDARPGRGDERRRPHRRDEQGQGRAVRYAGRRSTTGRRRCSSTASSARPTC